MPSFAPVGPLPEGDSLHSVARRLRVLVGERVTVEAPSPRAAALRIAPRLDGRRLESVEAVGKNLLLTFEGGVVLRSHLRMKGRWRVLEAGAPVTGSPWLVLRGSRQQAVLWHGPVLELGTAGIARLGPDILAVPPDIDGMISRLRGAAPATEIGEALLDQRLVAGIGNMWRAEILHAVRVLPSTALGDLPESTLRSLLATAHELMAARRSDRSVYRRAGLPCPRCGTPIRSRRHGDEARTAYWCPTCQERVSGGASSSGHAD